MNVLASLLLVLGGFLAANLLRHDRWFLPEGYLVLLLVSLLLASLVLPATGAFRPELRFALLRRLRRLLAGWAVVVMVLVGLGAMLKVTSDYSRLWFGTWVLLTGAGLFVALLLEQAWLRRRRGRPEFQRRVILAGAGDNAARLEQRISGDPASELRLVERFGVAWNNHPTRTVAELGDYVEKNPGCEVWVAVPGNDLSMLEQVLAVLRDTLVDVKVVPDLHQYRLLNQEISEWGGLPVINLSGTPMTAAERRLKNVFDWLLALVLTIVLAPLWLLLALAVSLSGPGPILFRQKRHGMGGETMEVYKFRSMRQHQEAAGNVTQAVPGDARVTPVGRLLRASSLDELPQLLNVLKGEMSLVGPRPHAVEHNQFFRARVPRYMLRHKVKPGMTGWAQVNGLRGLTDTPEKMALRIEHDLWYIQNWSLWLDLRILLLTPFAMLHRNAV